MEVDSWTTVGCHGGGSPLGARMSASSLFLRLLPDGPGSARAGSPQAGPARPPPWSGYSAALDPFAGRTARPATLEDDPFLGRPQRGTSSQAFRGCGCLVKPR